MGGEQNCLACKLSWTWEPTDWNSIWEKIRLFRKFDWNLWENVNVSAQEITGGLFSLILFNRPYKSEACWSGKSHDLFEEHILSMPRTWIRAFLSLTIALKPIDLSRCPFIVICAWRHVAIIILIAIRSRRFRTLYLSTLLIAKPPELEIWSMRFSPSRKWLSMRHWSRWVNKCQSPGNRNAKTTRWTINSNPSQTMNVYGKQRWWIPKFII